MAAKSHTSLCRETYKKISAYLDGELDTRTRRRIAAHLKACVHCRICLAMLKKSLELLRGMPPPRLPDGLRKKLKKIASP